MFLQKSDAAYQKKLVSIPLEKIRPGRFQPRRDFDDYDISGLAESIRHNGLLQPLSVRPSADGFYELIAGERRFRAAAMAGLHSVACIVHNIDDRQASIFSILENMQRKNLSIFEEAEGIARLIKEQEISHLETATYLGIAQSTLSNKLRILKLTYTQRERITVARLTERHARALVKLPEEKRNEALDIIIAKQLTVADTDKLVEQILESQDEKSTVHHQKSCSGITDIRLFANSLTRIVDTMKRSGVIAKTTKNETEDFVEYRIRIPKQNVKTKSSSTCAEEPIQLPIRLTSNKLANSKVT
ncbi:MAG: ParB/RepB/Spo0J family partition protein [Oscillospiraceae bacterium]|nr:ParB/RepB/Spo0J family partition protein [Oscillospiraceae bacterium]